MSDQVAPRKGRPNRSRILRALGPAGWDALEPVILAALATETPLLLIGPHGSGKTMLLNRLAEALGLSHRHYNASILSFDDLVGFPVPKDGGVVYLQTPATVWEAESVLIDEISRCRPEVQNKLFPLVHERVVQGMPLPKLRHRWAAMNPPASLDGAEDGKTPEYAGTEPLDVALADRFAFIVHAPSLSELSIADQRVVLRASSWRPEEVRPELLGILERAREAISDVEKDEGYVAAEYAILIASQMEAAGHPLSTRRAVQLARNVAAVRAVSLAASGEDDTEGDFLTALRSSLPDAAWGRRIPYPKLVGAHRSAWGAAGLAEGAPRRRLLNAKNPLARMAIAMDGTLPAHEAAGAFVDAYSSLPLTERLVTAAVVMPALSRMRDLPAAALEPVATDWAAVAGGRIENVEIGPGTAWKRKILSSDLPRINTKTEKGRSISAVAMTLLGRGQTFEMAALEAAWDRAVEFLRPPGRAAA